MIQESSNSELCENQWDDLFFLEIVSHNSELEDSWISLIDWPHKTSNIYIVQRHQSYDIGSNITLKVVAMKCDTTFPLLTTCPQIILDFIMLVIGHWHGLLFLFTTLGRNIIWDTNYFTIMNKNPYSCNVLINSVQVTNS